MENAQTGPIEREQSMFSLASSSHHQVQVIADVEPTDEELNSTHQKVTFDLSEEDALAVDSIAASKPNCEEVSDEDEVVSEDGECGWYQEAKHLLLESH